MRCSGYKKKPSKVYKPGADVHGLRLYGLGKCPACGRLVGLAPKAGTIVNHKRP